MVSNTALQRLSILFTFFTFAVSSVILPKPPGSFDVFYNTAEMVDENRIDPFDPARGKRSVMTSVYVPTHCEFDLANTSYLPAKTAEYYSQQFSAYGLPNGTLQSLNLQTCSELNGRPRSEHPVVIFSTGFGTGRHLYGALAQAVASFGYIVVSIDHPYDAEFLEYPDGTVVTGMNITDSEAGILLDVETRARDVSFVLNQLSSADGVQELIRGGSCLDTSRVAMFAHSLGGAAAAQAMLQDRRIVGGINLDGAAYGSVVRKGLDRPFLLFGHENKTLATEPSWGELWNNLRRWKAELQLAKSAHYTFSDMPFLLKALDAPAEVLQAAAERLGTLDGSRALAIVQTYVVAFLDFVLLGKSSEFLTHPSPEYPEVTLVCANQQACMS